jgi:hypothetical protein
MISLVKRPSNEEANRSHDRECFTVKLRERNELCLLFSFSRPYRSRHEHCKSVGMEWVWPVSS